MPQELLTFGLPVPPWKLVVDGQRVCSACLLGEPLQGKQRAPPEAGWDIPLHLSS